MCGQGVLESANHMPLYKGNFFDNRPHGYGTMFDENGNVSYKGYFRFGQAHGKGSFRKAGMQASGEWIFGQMICQKGKIVMCNEKLQIVTVYNGNLFHMEYHGRGTLKTFRMVGNKEAGNTYTLFSSLSPLYISLGSGHIDLSVSPCR